MFDRLDAYLTQFSAEVFFGIAVIVLLLIFIAEKVKD